MAEVPENDVIEPELITEDQLIDAETCAAGCSTGHRLMRGVVYSLLAVAVAGNLVAWGAPEYVEQFADYLPESEFLGTASGSCSGATACSQASASSCSKSDSCSAAGSCSTASSCSSGSCASGCSAGLPGAVDAGAPPLPTEVVIDQLPEEISGDAVDAGEASTDDEQQTASEPEETL